MAGANYQAVLEPVIDGLLLGGQQEDLAGQAVAAGVETAALFAFVGLGSRRLLRVRAVSI